MHESLEQFLGRSVDRVLVRAIYSLRSNFLHGHSMNDAELQEVFGATVNLLESVILRRLEIRTLPGEIR